MQNLHGWRPARPEAPGWPFSKPGVHRCTPGSHVAGSPGKRQAATGGTGRKPGDRSAPVLENQKVRVKPYSKNTGGAAAADTGSAGPTVRDDVMAPGRRMMGEYFEQIGTPGLGGHQRRD